MFQLGGANLFLSYSTQLDVKPVDVVGGPNRRSVSDAAHGSSRDISGLSLRSIRIQYLVNAVVTRQG